MTKEARICHGENTVSSANCAGKTGKLNAKGKKKKLEHSLNTIFFIKHYTQK